MDLYLRSPWQVALLPANASIHFGSFPRSVPSRPVHIPVTQEFLTKIRFERPFAQEMAPALKLLQHLGEQFLKPYVIKMAVLVLVHPQRIQDL